MSGTSKNRCYKDVQRTDRCDLPLVAEMTVATTRMTLTLKDSPDDSVRVAARGKRPSVSYNLVCTLTGEV